MKRFVKVLGLAAVALLAPSPARATDVLENSSLKAEVRELRKQVADLQRLADIANMEARVTSKELERVNERLERIERALARMAATTTRRASSFEPSGPMPPAVGTLRLVNRLPVTAYVSVNGVPYTVPAYERRAIAGVPAGPLTYEVTATGYYARATTASGIDAGETLTVNINAPAVPVFVFP